MRKHNYKQHYIWKADFFFFIFLHWTERVYKSKIELCPVMFDVACRLHTVLGLPTLVNRLGYPVYELMSIFRFLEDEPALSI